MHVNKVRHLTEVCDFDLVPFGYKVRGMLSAITAGERQHINLCQKWKLVSRQEKAARTRGS